MFNPTIPCLSTMTVFSGSCVARSPEGMHDLFQAVLSCHKLFCPPFYFPSFYSCPALLPHQHTFIAILLELYLLLSPYPWITASLTFLSFPLLVPFDSFSYFSPPFVEHTKRSPRHSINPHLLWLAAVLKTDEKWALLTTSSLLAFIYLCSLLLFTSFPSLSPPPSLFWHIIVPGPLLICCCFLSSPFCSSSNPPSALSEN